MHWEILPHPAYNHDLPPSDFQLFGPLKEALQGERFRVDDKVKLSAQRLDEQPQTFLNGYHEAAQVMAMI
jgi:hypothetical protein